MADRFDLINFGKSVVTTTGGTTANVNIDANTLFVDGVNNRVGVGIAAPAARLDVSGGIIGGELYTNSTTDALELYAGTAFNTGGAAISIRGTTTGFNNHGMEFYAGANERMRIDASGRVTTPAQPAFFAFRTDGSYTPGDNVVIPWNNTSYNIGGHYNTSNGRFTAPVAGLYYFHYHQYFRGNYTGRHNISRNNNQVALMQAGRGGTGGEWTHSLSIVISCAANDFVECRTNFTGELFMAADHSYFMGFLIG